MKIKFGKKSGLVDREAYTDWKRFEYVPYSRKGHPEYILVCDRVPGPEEEPELYRDAQVNDKNPEEVHLTYEGLSLEVILTTIAEDENFKAQNPKIAENNILFELEE